MSCMPRNSSTRPSARSWTMPSTTWHPCKYCIPNIWDTFSSFPWPPTNSVQELFSAWTIWQFNNVNIVLTDSSLCSSITTTVSLMSARCVHQNYCCTSIVPLFPHHHSLFPFFLSLSDLQINCFPFLTDAFWLRGFTFFTTSLSSLSVFFCLLYHSILPVWGKATKHCHYIVWCLRLWIILLSVK